MIATVKMSAVGMVRINFAGPHLWAAAMFARQAHAAEQRGVTSQRPPSFYDEAKSCVVAAIFLSVACVEAWAGEIAADPQGYFPKKDPAATRAALDKMIKWSSIECKYKRLAQLASVELPNYLAEPDAAMGDLILLRNKLVHFHAEWPDARSVHANVEARLSKRFLRSPLLHKSAPFFPDAFASYDGARWAVEIARGFVERIAARAAWEHPWTKAVHDQKLELPRARRVPLATCQPTERQLSHVELSGATRRPTLVLAAPPRSACALR